MNKLQFTQWDQNMLPGRERNVRTAVSEGMEERGEADING